MDTLLQNIGLFMCIAGIVVLALVAFAFSAFTRRNRPDQTNTPFTQRGHERPTYDSQRVETSGGFGGNVDTDASGRPIPQTGQQGGFGGARQFDRPDADADRDHKREDDDSIRSSGGFGGSS